jgi:S1-C subfamily serine protease
MPTGSFNANKKRYLCTKLAPLKKRKNEEAYLKINGIEINIDRKRYRQNYYESYADYLKQNIEHEYVSEHEIKIRRTIFEKDIDRFLAATNYLDTTDNNNLSSRYKIEIDMVVNAATEYKFGRYCVVELSTTVKLPAFFGMQREKTYITRSCIGFDDSNQDEANNTGLIANALENTLINLLEDASLKEKFVNPEEAMNKLLSKEEELVLENKLNGPSNIENATNAVVTILQKNWHGSGCIVSNNCYVITNYHVTGADTSEIYAIFTSGTKRRCRFIRGNYSSDLALLKIDTTISIPLKINTNKAIGVGADVYAIGTPRDINLGQTITKGIISAKRVMDGKIYIQSDASVNEGNSGGALINKEGELIGIVNSKLIGVGVEGVSFAIPAFYIEEALKVKIRN